MVIQLWSDPLRFVLTYFSQGGMAECDTGLTPTCAGAIWISVVGTEVCTSTHSK